MKSQLLNEIQPRLTISEKDLPIIADRKVGQKMRIILNYVVVEKTKSYAVLRCGGFHVITSGRMF